MTQEIQKFWDKQAKKFDKAEKQFMSVYQDVIAKTGSYLSPDDNALDYGCAIGSKTIALAGKVRFIHGRDISAEMIKLAVNKKDELEVSNISFSQGTIFDPELESGSFDKIIAFGIIHLLDDSQKVIDKIYELLKPGGLFISTTACMKDKMSFMNRMTVTSYLVMKRLGLSPIHLNMFHASDVERLFEEHHFQIVEAEKITHGLPAVFIVARKE
jgi:ubiquinone/menaquinone biosynthesis C-methylase UbiE